MILDKSFNPIDLEEKWYRFWESNKLFEGPEGTNSNESESYCIQLPPPNVTGTLHMGHAFQQTLMDCLVRYHRMEGKDTNWVVGTDHAGIATQLVVERQLESTGSSRTSLGRRKFVEKVWEWKELSGSTITKQMRRIGASANWKFASHDGKDSGYFTMDENMSKAVTEVFVRLFEEGLIYKGNRLVNWDPKLMTAVSDLEVDNVETDGKLWEIKYPSVKNGKFDLIVATTRPETMLGDVAIAVHPGDERYTKLIGEMVTIPLSGREIPVIEDEYVDPKFGTGCVKITPGHDFNDYAVGQRHSLNPINILNKDGTLNDTVPKIYRGLDRIEARKLILSDLTEAGYLVSEKKHKLNVPKSGRTGEIVEPLLTDQWFVRTEGLAKPALAAVKDGRIKFHPDNWTSTYNHWLENIQDWCISRQLWWGHQIPAWYDEEGSIFVARTEEEAKEKAQAFGSTGILSRDEDVLDTWFSSALVPFTSLGWPEKSPLLDKYLPSNVLVTGFDIIFFWVARMVMMTMHFTDKVPFRNVYINALIRDADGQKMSKSKGNTLDPLDLIDGIKLDDLIEKSTTGLLKEDHKGKVKNYLRKNFPNGIGAYGTDALRFTFASLATFSRTLNFDLNRCEGYRNFCNKLWNATRFVLMNCEAKDCGLENHETSECSSGGYLEFSAADRWISNEFERTIIEARKGFDTYRFDLAAGTIYKFIWDEYCDWYLEIAKIQLSQGNEAQQRATRRTLVRTLEKALRLAHPLIPFITEELWQSVAPVAGISGNSIMLTAYPVAGGKTLDKQADLEIDELKSIVSACRSLRSQMSVSPSERIPLLISSEKNISESRLTQLRILGKFSEVEIINGQLPDLNAPTESVQGHHLMLRMSIDVEEEINRIQREIGKTQKSVEQENGRLDNPSFIAKAPEQVVEAARKRVEDLREILENLNKQLKRLTSQS